MKMVVSASWEDLPADPIGLVLLRLPSLADRVRLRASCRPWRAAAKQMKPPLPPPLPWLAFRDGSIVDLDGAPVRCAPILRDVVFRYLAVDNSAFLIHDDGACSLMNPLSGLTPPLPKIAPVVYRAIDRYYFLPTISTQNNARQGERCCHLCLQESRCCQYISMCPESNQLPPTRHAKDISFLNGKLYALTEYEGLWSIKHSSLMPISSVNLNHRYAFISASQKTPRSTKYTGALTPINSNSESNGRLLMIRRWMAFPRKVWLGTQDRTSRFEVLEADLSTVPGQWVKVDNLDGQAIFLSIQCSKSVIAGQSAGVQADCIYFMHRVVDSPYDDHYWKNPLGDSGVYNMRDKEIKPLLRDAVMEELKRKKQFLTWFFPVDA
ncbi:unnamed protein product [Urochloa decumbens]|uniref:KIB1-4 beta-propeller domain-containing protein n=1 Tax=Urochloa decumbens TaxID=240449 RepID=A0ABC9BF24_9POAL